MPYSKLIFQSRRSPVFSVRGIVAASQPLAVQAGVSILEKGGNAADAAVATAAALNVTEPGSTGLGGDCFALFYDGVTGRMSALNGSGRAPKALTLELLSSQGFGKELPKYHPHVVTVPGACAGWFDLIERHGTLSMRETLAPAIRLAEEGFPVAPITAHGWQGSIKKLMDSSPGGRELTVEGRAPHVGEVFRNPTLSRTLRLIAEQGRKAYYEGEIAERIIKTL
ncbi:MAG TPA: gamma-glutamyltransferase, partial [bacterium]|nr:gamma-glutamyltransferase [bacterium]